MCYSFNPSPRTGLVKCTQDHPSTVSAWVDDAISVSCACMYSSGVYSLTNVLADSLHVLMQCVHWSSVTHMHNATTAVCERCCLHCLLASSSICSEQIPLNSWSMGCLLWVPYGPSRAPVVLFLWLSCTTSGGRFSMVRHFHSQVHKGTNLTINIQNRQGPNHCCRDSLGQGILP